MYSLHLYEPISLVSTTQLDTGEMGEETKETKVVVEEAIVIVVEVEEMVMDVHVEY